MNVEDTVNGLIYAYPDLFKDSSYEKSLGRVLTNLFFVVGNGYDWVGGQLVSPDQAAREVLKLPDDYFDKQILSTEEDESRFIKEMRDRHGISFKPRVMEADFPLDIYPISDYSKISSMPEDVQPDWLMAAVHALEVARDYLQDEERYKDHEYISNVSQENADRYLQQQRYTVDELLDKYGNEVIDKLLRWEL